MTLTVEVVFKLSQTNTMGIKCRAPTQLELGFEWGSAVSVPTWQLPPQSYLFLASSWREYFYTVFFRNF